ncbi:MAG: DUF1214 domain-containing protein [Bosea sp. (in: a-proteobacteria)]
MRSLQIIYVLALAAMTGLGTASHALRSQPPLGQVQIGAWTVWPRIGSRDIDPYARAILARGVHLPLGLGEGLTLVADRDQAGSRLSAACRYAISGAVPTARGWTLTVSDENGVAIPAGRQRTGFSDAEVTRRENGQLAIGLSNEALPGDWLPLPKSGGFTLVLRLYDTPVSGTASELSTGQLPRIERVSCT